jgi:hypothetical protein
VTVGGKLSHPDCAPVDLESVRRAAYLGSMVTLEAFGDLYELSDNEATLLAQNLRNYAKGVFPHDVELGARLSGTPDWTAGALAAADFIEEALVGNLTVPVPLEGKAAVATLWTLRLIQGLMGSTSPNDVAALRDALATRLSS